VQIRDPETGEPRRTGEDGVLWVRGPNVMQGYLGEPERTREVLVDGWYDTGDIAHLDAEGFLTITDRLSRFSKIGGEMVSHTQVEEALRTALRELAPDAHAEVCITAVNDEHKGERLVAVHTPIPIPFTSLIEHARRAGVPNLFLPRADHSFEVAAMPQLGTGKLDLQGLRTIARERVALSGA
jgi:acyl-[acyl-carrier-protein]-phospholipid O-acyltransferase/long-chain-fatty-acid--[acyl-carrier-protein] ligase